MPRLIVEMEFANVHQLLMHVVYLVKHVFPVPVNAELLHPVKICQREHTAMQLITYVNALLLLHPALDPPTLALVVFVNAEHLLLVQVQAIHVPVAFVNADHLRLVRWLVKLALMANANAGHPHPVLA